MKNVNQKQKNKLKLKKIIKKMKLHRVDFMFHQKVSVKWKLQQRKKKNSKNKQKKIRNKKFKLNKKSMEDIGFGKIIVVMKISKCLKNVQK